MLEAVFGVEVGLPEEVEVEAELVIIKVKVSGPPGSQAAAETQCWLQSHNVSLSPLRPHNPQHSSQHRPALSSNQPPPPCHTVVCSSSSSSSSSSSVAKLLLGTFSAHSARELQADPRRPRWSVF